MTLLTLELFLVVAGVVVLAVAASIARDASHPRRWGAAAFWALLALALIGGKQLPPMAVGYGLLAMTLLAATRQVEAPGFAAFDPAAIDADVARLRNRLVWPVVLVPVIAIAAGFALPLVRGAGFVLVDPKQGSLVGIGLGCVCAMVVALRVTRERPAPAVAEGGRLLQLLGWTLLLPPMLAALGGILRRRGSAR